MQAKPDNMYVLKDLYAEIGFFDRKIAHCQVFEKYDSEPARALRGAKADHGAGVAGENSARNGWPWSGVRS